MPGWRGRGIRGDGQPCLRGRAVSGAVGGVVLGGMAALAPFHGADVEKLALGGRADPELVPAANGLGESSSATGTKRCHTSAAACKGVPAS